MEDWRKKEIAAREYANAHRDDCCCGNPECTDFNDRMLAAGIPVDELVEVRYTIPLRPRGRKYEDD